MSVHVSLAIEADTQIRAAYEVPFSDGRTGATIAIDNNALLCIRDEQQGQLLLDALVDAVEILAQARAKKEAAKFSDNLVDLCKSMLIDSSRGKP